MVQHLLNSQWPKKNLILIRFKIILDLTQPLKCLEVLCAAKRRMIKELSDRMVCIPWQSDITGTNHK